MINIKKHYKLASNCMVKLTLFAIVYLISFLSFNANAESKLSPLCFYAPFDGSLNAQTKGDGKPVKVNGPVKFMPGKFGQALLCGDNGAEVFYKTARNLYRTAGTIEMWIRPLNWTGKKETFHVFLEAKNPGWLVFYRYYKRGMMTLLGKDSKNYRYTTSMKFRWKAGEWHHLAATWCSTRIETYIDGKRVGLNANPPMPDAWPKEFRLGDNPWSSKNRNQQTLLDEVKIYSCVLDAKSIALAAQNKPIEFKPQISARLKVNAKTNTLSVLCDAAGLVEKGSTVKVNICNLKTKKALLSRTTSKFKSDIGQVNLLIGKLAPGQYKIHIELLGSNKKLVAQTTLPFTKPEAPKWRKKALGMEDIVLPPWTALKVQKNASNGVAVKSLDKEYNFSLFPTAINSGKTELLCGQVELKAIVDGKTLDLSSNAKSQLKNATNSKINFEGENTNGPLKILVKNKLEYDGYLWTDLSIKPKSPMTIDKLTLEWAMPASLATLTHIDFGNWAKNLSKKIPAKGLHVGFAPFFWVGNENYGLSWFAESPENWTIAKGKSVISIVPDGDKVKVSVNLISKPTRINNKLNYSFGMMPTPTKPRPVNARKWRMRPAPNETFDVVWPNSFAKYFGFTEAKDPKKFSAWVKNAHEQRKVKVLPYINVNNISAGVPEWIYYKSEWEDPSRTCAWADVAAMGYASMGTCPASRDWQDYILYNIGKMIDRYQVDGFYIDCWAPYPCKAGPCGWKDKKGRKHTIFPIRAYRQILKRLRTLMHQKGIKPFIMVHNSAQMIAPMMSFADVYLDGEQFRNTKLKDDYLKVMSPDAIRTEFSRNWGTVGFFLPELHKEYHAVGTPNLATYLLLHDITPWSIFLSQPILNRFFEAYDEFGIDKAEFLPYWQKNTSGVKADSKILVSVFRRKNSVLFAVMNTGNATDAVLKLDPGILNMSKITDAVDIFTNKKLKLNNNKLVVPLKKHQGRVIRLYKEAFQVPTIKKYSSGSILLNAKQAVLHPVKQYTPKLVKDPLSLLGEAAMQPGDKYAWSVQWSKINFNKLKKDTPYIFRAHCRIVKRNDIGDAVRFGFYDYRKKTVTSSKIIKSKAIPNSRYIWLEAGKITAGVKGYIFSAPWTNRNVVAIYIDAVELIPEDEYNKK